MESDTLGSLGVDSFAALELSLTLEEKLGKKSTPTTSTGDSLYSK
jgi:acyl carrier protein